MSGSIRYNITRNEDKKAALALTQAWVQGQPMKTNVTNLPKAGGQ